MTPLAGIRVRRFRIERISRGCCAVPSHVGSSVIQRNIIAGHLLAQ